MAFLGWILELIAATPLPRLGDIFFSFFFFKSAYLTGTRAASREQPWWYRTGGCVPFCTPARRSPTLPGSTEAFPFAVETLSWNRDVWAKCDIFAAGRHIRTTSPLLFPQPRFYLWVGGWVWRCPDWITLLKSLSVDMFHLLSLKLRSVWRGRVTHL